jgi:acyl-coenzyme A synthetase/AMP-(fatty) acid ligase
MNAAAIPLLGHSSLEATFAYRPEGVVSVADFLNDVFSVAAVLPEGRHILNVCQDRYRFTVGLAAGLIAGKISLLPSTHTPEMVRQLKLFAPDLFCLSDSTAHDIDLPQMAYPETTQVRAEKAALVEGKTSPPLIPLIPLIPADRLVAYVFTSGSTGTPIPHKKHWAGLVKNARAEAHSLGLDACGDGQIHAVVATVPPQHMYGFESSVLVSLHGGVAAWSGRPFYPADIAAALANVPRPRMLVTTPFHLRALLDAEVTIPALDRVLSATAPLSASLALNAENRLGAPLQEIYGSTETGQIATRSPTAGIEWILMNDIRLATEGEQTWAAGGHLEGCTLLGDVLEITTNNRFLLHGRSTDLINIAGKRTSLAYLNHQLTHLPGVVDGCFYMPDDEGDDGVTRLIACVVAPGLKAADLTLALRHSIDPVFLPRPLLLVEALPRNATGKLPRRALQALLATLLAPKRHTRAEH